MERSSPPSSRDTDTEATDTEDSRDSADMAINVFAQCLLSESIGVCVLKRKKRTYVIPDEGNVGEGDVDARDDEEEAEAREVLHVVTPDTLAEPSAYG